MLTEQRMFLELLGTDNAQFVIPVFQRVYSWNTVQCSELWMDIIRSGRTKNIHFVGTVLYAKEPDKGDGLDRYAIIDGQQRTSTLTLLLLAFTKYLRAHELAFGHVDADFIEQHYLRVKGRQKLVLSRTDRSTLFSLMDGAPLPQRKSTRILDNYQWFVDKMARDDFQPELLWEGLQQLLMISANLTGEERPQLIFEALNARGTPLTTGDMVRNYLLISESHEEQERLYEEYWKPIEILFGDDPESAKLNAGIRAWLTIRFVKVHIHDKGETYSVFKTYVEDEYEGPLEDLLIELRDFCLMWAENYKDHDINTGSKEFRSWDWAKGKRTTLVPPRDSPGGF